MTSYNGNPITYDNGCNPLTYNNGSAYTFTWEGRRMQTATKGNTTWSYTYNAEGLRTSKTVGSATYNYYWNGSQLEAMTWSTGWFKFYYDASGTPYAVKNYDAYLNVERTYLYIINVQGDVVALIDAANGQTAVSYEYDAWGKLISKTSSSSDYASVYEYNPLTYRGYIYDNETGFYYLQTRYYDPTVGRFINADGQLNGGILGCNQYAYCENNPIKHIDPTGRGFWDWLEDIGKEFAKAAAIGLAVVAIVGGAAVTIATGGGGAAVAAPAIAEAVALAVEVCTVTAVAGAATVVAAKVGGDISDSINSSRKSSGGSDPVRAGQAGEKAAGIEKNTEVIEMFNNNRIPDGFSRNAWVQEVKNVSKQGFTSQLKDYFRFAYQNNMKMELFVRYTTNLSKPLQVAIKEYGVVLRYIWP